MKFTYGGKPVKTIEYPTEAAKPGDQSPLGGSRKVKVVKQILTISGILMVVFAANLIMPAQTKPQPASAATASDKYDGDCQPTDTAGRCADKCPADTSEGTYYLQGYDKDTGAAVCGFTYYHECPYAAAQPADGPVCQKLAAEQQQPVTTTPAATTPSNQCGGAK